MTDIHKLCILPLSLLVACAGAATPDPESAADVLNEPQIVGEEVAYEVDGVQLKGYLAHDKLAEGPRPGVLIVHEWWGHNDYVRERARQVAELGYTAFALDMYGAGKLAEHPEDAKKFMMEVMANMPVAEARFHAAHKLLTDHASTDATKIAAMGYCFGGGVVLHMARTGMDLKGVASFHGTLATQTPAQTGAVKAKLFVAHGADDPFIDAAQVEAFHKEMADAGVDMDFVAYAGAKHGFTVKAATEKGERLKLPLAYDENADRDSWSRLEKFLDAVFAN